MGRCMMHRRIDPGLMYVALGLDARDRQGHSRDIGPRCQPCSAVPAWCLGDTKSSVSELPDERIPQGEVRPLLNELFLIMWFIVSRLTLPNNES